MDYHDVDETRQLLEELGNLPTANVETIGVSLDYRMTPPVEYPILAIRFMSEQRRRGQPPKPAILFDAGIHPREWIAAESLVELCRHLGAESQISNSDVSRLLEEIDVWVIPMTNPVGRVIDDPNHGDARNYYKDGPEAGGWRGNGDTRISPFAVDLARNFSRNWERANGNPHEKHWRGFAPFCGTESTAMKQFVQNHMIAMAVHIHSNTQDIVTCYDSVNSAGLVIRERAAEAWLTGAGNLANELKRPLPDLHLEMDCGQAATSNGQYQAWMMAESDTLDQPDHGTARGIQTVGIEMPFDNPKHRNYYDGLFQFEPKDGSSSFHPSGANVRLLLQRAFVPMAIHLISQARAPYCATRNTGGEVSIERSGFARGDVGLLAARIVHGKDSVPSLSSHQAVLKQVTEPLNFEPAYDSIDSGSHFLESWIQNFTPEGTQCLVTALLEHRPLNGSNKWARTLNRSRVIRLTKPLERTFGRVAFRATPNREYRLTLRVDAKNDALPVNNLKVFRFICEPAD